MAARASNECLWHRTSGGGGGNLYPPGHEASDFVIITTSEGGQKKCFAHQIARPQIPCATSSTTTHILSSHRLLKRENRSRSIIIEGTVTSTSCCRLGIFIIVSNIVLGLLVSGGSGSSSERMVRLCIASVDPIKLSSQCVMCNRREFPLTVIDCTGITKVNDLIANPLSVQEATCLIYNCRRQVPDVKPEVYHGSVSNAVNYRGHSVGAAAGASAVSNYQHHGGLPVGLGSSSSIYETMTPSSMFGGGYAMQAPGLLAHQEQQQQQQQAQIQQQYIPAASPYTTRLGLAGYGAANPAFPSVLSPLASLVPRGLIGGPSFMSPNRQQALPYALVPAPSGIPFGSRKYKAALVPLFKRNDEHTRGKLTQYRMDDHV